MLYTKKNMKIYIIGPSGSGKTTIAKQLSNMLKIPHTDLDAIFWEPQANTFGVKREAIIRDAMYQNLINQKSWIIEGAYLSWPAHGFRLADKLIFLEVAYYKVTLRILKRFIRRKIGVDHCRKKESISGLVKLIIWNKNQAIKIKEHCSSEHYPHVIRLSNHREINQFLKEMAASYLPSPERNGRG